MNEPKQLNVRGCAGSWGNCQCGVGLAPNICRASPGPNKRSCPVGLQ